MSPGQIEGHPKVVPPGGARRVGMDSSVAPRAETERNPPARSRPRPGREPRAEEFVLMRSLLDGPKPVTAGPIGQCVKRGWCRALMIDLPEAAPKPVRVVFALTDAGRDLVAGPVAIESAMADRQPLS